MNLTHHFLLAMPGLVGDYFADSLTYVCEHNDDGAMGIIVNRPAELSLVELLAQVGLPANRRYVDTPVLEGGPVSAERGFVLHRGDGEVASSTDIGNGMHLATALDVLDAIANDNGPDEFQVALGYAGWGAGQLESEVAANAWLTLPADPEIVFSVPYAERSQTAAASLGVDMRLMSPRPGHA